VIGFDESAVGYSLASCSPAEIASASPASDDSEGKRLFEKEKLLDGKFANCPLLSQERGSPQKFVAKLCPKYPTSEVEGTVKNVKICKNGRN